MKSNTYTFRPWFLMSSASFTAFGLFAGIMLCEPPPSGANLFKSKCAMCHGPQGAGNTPMGQKLKLRDLRTAEVQKLTDDQLTAIITTGKPPMPAHGKSLSTEDIHALVAYLRSIANKS